ncbi:hypothetical protein [Streptomyces huasconensis]|uniref:hypothetical protein n=1 Tax=Streptomyces huasconensis TaxID=1854574 RepID=UPI0033D8D4BA
MTRTARNAKGGKYARTAAVIVLALSLVACSAGGTPPQKPSASASPGPTGSIVALPTPRDYMEFLCTRFETLWLGWRPRQKISPGMKSTVKDLARRGSKVREEAKRLLSSLEAGEVKVADRELRDTLDGLVDLTYLDLAGECSAETSRAP